MTSPNDTPAPADTVVRIIEGKPVHGTLQSDGSFLSTDGTILVTGKATEGPDGTTIPAGTVEHGVTTPDHMFLEGATTCTPPGGQTLYGYAVGNDFCSVPGHGGAATIVLDGKQVITGTLADTGVFTADDGSAYFVSTDGIESGVVLPDDRFLPGGEMRIIEGKPVYGVVQSDGSFLSTDGTILVTGKATEDPDGTVIAAGTVEHGVTTPDNRFLKGGSVRVLPGGQKLSGYAVGGDFYSVPGPGGASTIILANGTVHAGTLDTSNGIFTATGGGIYFVGDDGIQSATLQTDGSYLLANQQTLMTAQSWQADFEKISSDILTIKSRIGPISDEIATIRGEFTFIESAWRSPAGESFSDVATRVTGALFTLKDLLSEMVTRMEASYANYVVAEEKALQNMTK